MFYKDKNGGLYSSDSKIDDPELIEITQEEYYSLLTNTKVEQEQKCISLDELIKQATEQGYTIYE